MPPETEGSVPRPSRRRVRGSRGLDGLKIRLLDDPAPSGAELGRALRTLARMMVRREQVEGDHQAIITETKASSELTVAPRARRVNTDEAA